MMKQKNVLITGAGSGIGRACAIQMAKEGKRVLITGRVKESLEATKNMIEEAGGFCDYITGDVSNCEEVKYIVSHFCEKYGTIDILVNNAAVFLTTDILGKEQETNWERLIDINVLGVVNMIHQVVPGMVEEKEGSIVNISSIDAFAGCYGYTGYSATKGAIVSLTRSLALELGKYNIRVNAVAPGITDTPMTHQRIEQNKDKYLSRLALQQIGKAEDIANAITFLASDQSKYITGEILNVNGGMQFV